MVWLLALSGPVAAAEGDGAGHLGVEDISKSVAGAYEGAKTLSVEITQTSSGPSYFEPIEQTGRFVVQQPDSIRWEMDGSGGKTTYLSDGKTLWIEQEAEKTVQVFKGAAPMVKRYLRLMTGDLDALTSTGEFTGVQVYGGTADDAVAGWRGLSFGGSATNQQIKELRVFFDAEWHLRRVVMVSPFGDRTQMDLATPTLNLDVAAGSFVWAKKDGWHVVPMD